MHTLRRIGAPLLIAGVVTGWLGMTPSMTPVAQAVPAAPCQPEAQQLFAAMAAGIPPTSPIWDQSQAAMQQSGSESGAAMAALIATLNRNNYTWDCSTQQLIGPNGLPAAGPTPAGASESTGNVSSGPGATAVNGGVTGEGATGPAVTGAPRGGGSSGRGGTGAGGVRTSGGSSGSANGNLASSQLPSDNGGAGTGSTLPVVAALVLSSALVVFVSFRHYRRAST